MPTANINDHTMYYEVHGDGPPVLCMTGWGTICHGRSVFLPESLRGGDYQVILFDHRGVGESEDVADIPHSTDLYAEDAVGLLNYLDVDKVHVVGMGGMGGLIGQKLAINHHDRVASLAMFGAWAKADTYLADQLRLLDMLHEKIGFEAYQMCAALFCYTPEHYNANRDSIVSPKGPWQMLRDNQAVHAKFIKACLDHDTISDLRRIDQPTLLAFGGVEDLMTGDRIGQVMKTGIPHAEYAIVEGAPHAHQAYPEAERALSDMIDRFLKRQLSKSVD